jgi:hypothetical protein
VGRGPDIFGYYGVILYTIDGGLTWTIQNILYGDYELFDVFFIDQQIGWAVGRWYDMGTMEYFGYIVNTTDGGVTWSTDYSSSGGLNDIHFVNSQRGWIAGDGGTILSTEDGGGTWQTEDSGIPYYLGGISAVEGEVWAVGGSAVILHNNYSAVSVENPRSPVISNYELLQNHPNPFNPSTHIRFALPEESHVKLEIYNTLGERIATLVDEPRPTGYYTEQFDAAGLASGLYFYRLAAGDFVETKKLILLK